MTDVEKSKITNKVLKILFDNNISKFKFRGNAQKFKLDISWED